MNCACTHIAATGEIRACAFHTTWAATVIDKAGHLRQQIADEFQILAEENKALLLENAKLRRILEAGDRPTPYTRGLAADLGITRVSGPRK